MDRTVSIRPAPFAPGLEGCSVTVQDVFHCAPKPDVLIAPWTLEQFDTHDDVVAFCRGGQPAKAVNFDYYEPPRERIRYRQGALFYATDGRKAGQIGIRRSSRPELIGMFDPRNSLLVICKVLGDTESIRSLNIPDNEQKNGPFSSDDVFSIYISPESLRFLELETIVGCANRDDSLVPQPLLSETTYICGPAERLRELVEATLGIAIVVDPVESGRGVA
jgi:hypothetical protein